MGWGGGWGEGGLYHLKLQALVNDVLPPALPESAAWSVLHLLEFERQINRLTESVRETQTDRERQTDKQTNGECKRDTD